MATLADALRGYTPPTESALADPIVEHFRTLPQQLATNQAAMDKTMGGMYKTDLATGQPNPNYYPEAMGEFTQMMPMMMGSIGKVSNGLKRMAIAQKNAALPVEKGGLGLAPDNTQWQRAEAMGFNVREPMYHGTKADFTEFSLGKHGTATDKGDFGEAVYATTNPQTANVYASEAGDYTNGQIMPLYVKEGKRLVTQGQNEFNNLIERLGGEEAWFEMRNHPKKYAQAIKDLGYDSVRDMGYHQTAIFDPKNIRSKFAAFDPKKANSPDLLAGALAVPMIDEDNRRAVLEQLFNKQK
jgi:hypothetical protein